MIDLENKSVGIIGLGQMGGSIALRLAQQSPHTQVIGFDLEPTLSEASKQRGGISQAAASIDELIEMSDLVIIALPMAVIFETIVSRSERLRHKIAVTDTGSLKKEVMQLAAQCGLHNYVGGHPLAGTEKRGADSWNATLFEPANYFVTLNPDTRAESVNLTIQLIELLGASVVKVDAAEHDATFAATSNLPHLFAYCLKNMIQNSENGSRNEKLFNCPSYHGATRVAASDPEMVFQMLWYNRDNLHQSLNELILRLDDARKALDKGESQRFRQIFGIQ